jgi:hypothetical protein
MRPPLSGLGPMQVVVMNVPARRSRSVSITALQLTNVSVDLYPRNTPTLPPELDPIGKQQSPPGDVRLVIQADGARRRGAWQSSANV